MLDSTYETGFVRKQNSFHQSSLFHSPKASELPEIENWNQRKRTVRTPPGFESKQCDLTKFNNQGRRTERPLHVLENPEPERRSPEEWKPLLIKQNRFIGKKWLEFIMFITDKLTKDPEVILDEYSIEWKITFKKFVQLIQSFKRLSEIEKKEKKEEKEEK